MKSATLQKLIADYIDAMKGCDSQSKKKELAEYIAFTLEQEKNIKYQLQKLRKSEQQETEKYKKIISEIKGKVFALQMECPHWESAFYGDPAGGSDSYSECLICGQQMKR